MQVSATILQIYKCQDIQGTYYLTVDARITCFCMSESQGVCDNGDWVSSALLGAVAAAVYPLGIPLCFFLLLFWNRALLFEDTELVDQRDRLEASLFELREQQCELQSRAGAYLSAVKAEVVQEEIDETERLHEEVQSQLDHMAKVQMRLGFLYNSYEPPAFWWECAELLKKFLLCSLIIFIDPGTLAQIAVAFVISIAFFVAEIFLSPYLEDNNDLYSFLSSLSTLLTLFCGLVLKVPSDLVGSLCDMTAEMSRGDVCWAGPGSRGGCRPGHLPDLRCFRAPRDVQRHGDCALFGHDLQGWRRLRPAAELDYQGESTPACVLEHAR